MDNLKKASTRTEDRTDSCVTILNEVMKARQDLSVENVTKHFKYYFNDYIQVWSLMRYEYYCVVFGIL